MFSCSQNPRFCCRLEEETHTKLFFSSSFFLDFLSEFLAYSLLPQWCLIYSHLCLQTLFGFLPKSQSNFESELRCTPSWSRALKRNRWASWGWPTLGWTPTQHRVVAFIQKFMWSDNSYRGKLLLAVNNGYDVIFTIESKDRWPKVSNKEINHLENCDVHFYVLFLTHRSCNQNTKQVENLAIKKLLKFW